MSTTPAPPAPSRRPPPPPGGPPAPQPAGVAPTIRKAGAVLLPERIVVFAVEGWGKTTLGAYAPRPVFILAPGETGIDTLRAYNRCPEVDAITPANWADALAAVDYLSATATGHKTLVIDALGGFERLCHEHVCQRDFKGEWGERGFSAFQKGYDLSIGEWLVLLRKLDRLRAERGVTILALAHAKVKNFRNPLGPDFDKYVVDLHEKTWGVTHKWADAALFGNFYQVLDGEKKGRVRGVGGNERVLYTEHTDAYDGKNRYGLPAALGIPNDPTKVWETLSNAIAAQKGGE